MNYFLKVVLFVVVFLALFAYIGLQIPQQASLPPTEEKFDATQIKSKEDLSRIGQKIFYGKGQCALCHSIGHSATARCPNLQGVGGKLTREFIYESLTQPQAYTYMDYTFSPPKFFPAKMPVITKPPIDLNPNELLSVISFLQSQGGEVSVDPSEITQPGGGASMGRAGDPAAGGRAVKRLGCAGCHGKIGWPGLANKDEGAVRAAILDETAGLGAGARPVHAGLDRKLSIRDFNDVAAYLKEMKPAGAK